MTGAAEQPVVYLCAYGHSEWNHGFLAFTSLLHQRVIQSLALPKARFSVISHSTKLTLYLYRVPLGESSHGGGGENLGKHVIFQIQTSDTHKYSLSIKSKKN